MVQSPVDEFPGLAGVYQDDETPSARLRQWLSPWERWECAAEDFVETGDDIVVLARYRGTGKGSGAGCGGGRAVQPAA
jgi:hypothetical protein